MGFEDKNDQKSIAFVSCLNATIIFTKHHFNLLDDVMASFTAVLSKTNMFGNIILYQVSASGLVLILLAFHPVDRGSRLDRDWIYGFVF